MDRTLEQLIQLIITLVREKEELLQVIAQLQKEKANE